MSEDDLLDMIHATMMEWCKEEMDANEGSDVSLEERFDECKVQIAEALFGMTTNRVYKVILI